MILRPISFLVLLGCIYLASTDYGAAKHTKLIIKEAGPSIEHPWVGYTRHYPRSIPRPLLIKKWHPYWDPTYVASWVSSKPVGLIGGGHHGGGHGGGFHDGGHGGGFHDGGHGGGFHDGGHGGGFHDGGHGGGHHDIGHGGVHDEGFGPTGGKGGHGFITEDIPHGFGPPKHSSVGDDHGPVDFHGGSDFIPPTGYQEPAVVHAPVSEYVPPVSIEPVYKEPIGPVLDHAGPTGSAYVPPGQGSILPPIESPPIYIPQEVTPTFNQINPAYVPPSITQAYVPDINPRIPNPNAVFKAEPVYTRQIIGSGDSAEDFRSQIFAGNFAKSVPTQQFAHGGLGFQQGQQFGGSHDSVSPFVVAPQSAPLPLENEGSILSNSIDDTYPQTKRSSNN